MGVTQMHTIGPSGSMEPWRWRLRKLEKDQPTRRVRADRGPGFFPTSGDRTCAR